MSFLEAAAQSATAGDPTWSNVIGGAVGALIGVVGLAIVTFIQRRDSDRSRFEHALGELMSSMGHLRAELEKWADEPVNSMGYAMPGYRRLQSTQGGPSMEPLKTLVDVALMSAKRRDAKVMGTIGMAIFTLDDTPLEWRLEWLPKIVQSIRLWRTGERKPRVVRSEMAQLIVESTTQWSVK